MILPSRANVPVSEKEDEREAKKHLVIKRFEDGLLDIREVALLCGISFDAASEWITHEFMARQALTGNYHARI